MKNSKEITSILSEISKEAEILTERFRKEMPKNTTIRNNRMDVENYNTFTKGADSEKERKRLSDRIEKEILTNMLSQAGYTWKGISPNYKAKFLNSPENVDIVQDDVNSYRDPLWFKLTRIPRSKGFVMEKYVDENGKILPGYEDIVDRVNSKYGLTIDPSESITKANRGDHNYEEFKKWAINYFIPWYKENSTQGKTKRQELDGKLKYDYSRIKDLGQAQEEPEEDTQDNGINLPSEMDPNDDSVIEKIINYNDFPKAIKEMEHIIKGESKIKSYPKQIYNTLNKLYKKATIFGETGVNADILRQMIDKYKNQHPDLVNKKESTEENVNSSWLTHNGDYSILDKLNNLFRFKESKEKNMTNDKFKLLKEDNLYTSINTNENEFDPSKVTSDVFNDEEETGISEEDKLKKNKLTKEVLDKINDTLKLNKEVQNILDEIREINNGNNYNVWVVNEEGNTASLASKNAKIFKQNMNLCLSHDNDIEVFKSVKELHRWLREHNYPMPRNIQLHESVIYEDDEQDEENDSNLDPIYKGLGKWIDILHLRKGSWTPEEQQRIYGSNKKEEAVIDEDFCCGNMGDTTSASLGTALQYLYKNKGKKESLQKGEFVNKLKQLKEDDTDVTSSFDSAIQSNAGFGADSTSTGDDLNTSTDTMSQDMSTQGDAVDLGQGDSIGDAGGFGDLNINTGGYGPDEGTPEDDSMAMPVPQEEFQIVDVLTDSVGNIRVKVKNLNSGEIEYKDLSEIDI